jgi:hypothetical protein
MKNWWIKFGCFLTGYNYHIVMASSEVSVKAVKRYTSAMIIVCILWAFVGFTFTQRYIKTELLGAIIGSIVMCIIIIQIERQIILSVHKNKFLYFFRGIIAIMMAALGSIIIDQLIFKEDIEQKKIMLLDAKVNAVYPLKAKELKLQIQELDSTINAKETERKVLLNDISQNPTIKVVNSQIQAIPIATTTTDSSNLTTTKTSVIKAKSSTITSIQNPKVGLYNSIDGQIKILRDQKNTKDNSLLSLRTDVEKEIKSKVGFLDELNVMMNLLKDSLPARIVWLIWVLFLFGLEMFILVSKWGEKANDYDATVIHQMDLQIKKLELLANRSSGK